MAGECSKDEEGRVTLGRVMVDWIWERVAVAQTVSQPIFLGFRPL